MARRQEIDVFAFEWLLVKSPILLFAFVNLPISYCTCQVVPSFTKCRVLILLVDRWLQLIGQCLLFVALARGSKCLFIPPLWLRVLDPLPDIQIDQNFVLLWKTFLICAFIWALEPNVNWVLLTPPLLENFRDFIAKYTWMNQQTYSSLDSYFWVMRAITFLDKVLWVIY